MASAPAQPPLSLTDLGQHVERAARAIRDVATPAATWESYASALRYWCAWARLRLGHDLPLPTPVAVAKLFVLDHFGEPVRTPAGSGHARVTVEPALPTPIDQALVAGKFKAALGRLKISTIDHRLSVLSWVHREKKLESPTGDPSVRRLLSDCRKLAREMGEAPAAKTAATQLALDAMLATCDESLEGLRDRALLLFGWSSGGRRRSEIAQAEVGDLEWLDEHAAVFRMRRSKTGDAAPKPVTDEAAAALKTWLAKARIEEGALFRRVWRGARVGPALSPHAIAAIVKRRATLAGLKGDFAGHSLRRGFVTEAGLNSMPLAQTMAMTGHRNVKSVVRYSEAGDIVSSAAAGLLSTGRKRSGKRTESDKNQDPNTTA